MVLFYLDQNGLALQGVLLGRVKWAIRMVRRGKSRVRLKVMASVWQRVFMVLSQVAWVFNHIVPFFRALCAFQRTITCNVDVNITEQHLSDFVYCFVIQF